MRVTISDCLRNAHQALEQAIKSSTESDRDHHAHLAQVWQNLAQLMKKNGLTELPDPPER